MCRTNLLEGIAVQEVVAEQRRNGSAVGDSSGCGGLQERRVGGVEQGGSGLKEMNHDFN